MSKLFTEDFYAANVKDYDNKEQFKSLYPKATIEITIFYPEEDDNLPKIYVECLHLNDSSETIIAKLISGGYLITRYEVDTIKGFKTIVAYFCNNLKEIKKLIK